VIFANVSQLELDLECIQKSSSLFGRDILFINPLIRDGEELFAIYIPNK
jgi:hypothetical protein